MDLLNILKNFEFEGANDGYLIDFEDNEENEKKEEEDQFLTQNSLAKRASSSSLKLTRSYLLNKLQQGNFFL